MKRYAVLGKLFWAAFALALVPVFGGLEAGKDKEVTVYEEELVIPGVDEEFVLIFLADTHVSLCDVRDQDVMEKARSRYESFRDHRGQGADESFQELMDYVKEEEPDLLILGGDIVDSALWASIDFVSAALKDTGVPVIYAMGNHDFEHGKEYFSEQAYQTYLPRLQDISETCGGFQQKEYEDFVIFSVDDKCNQVSEEALKAMEQLSLQKKPVILVTHVPIEPAADTCLLEETKRVWGLSSDGHSRVLLGQNSCVPNETTAKFLELVLAKDSPVVLVLAGHLHFGHRDMLTEDIVQIVAGAGYQKCLVKIKIRPQ
ncbi:MAG: metallophosphoesterase [Lachnospiraceae bacterium]|nr:metallophosphoesterase [Lachnospiraceae bacterium]